MVHVHRSFSLVYRIAILLLVIIATIMKAGQTSVTVTSAASYQLTVAPDSLATLFGTNLAAESMSAQLDAEGNLPTSLGGTSVEISGQQVGLIYVSPTQINFWVPPGTTVGHQVVTVKGSDGTVSATGTVNIAQTAPALFSLDASGQGLGAILNAVTYQLGPFFVNTSENTGTDKRTRLAIFGTGLRLAGGGTGANETNVAAYVGATAVQPGLSVSLPVEYAGPAPGFFGLDQVNVILPESLDGVGIVDIIVAAGGGVSNSVSLQIWSIQSPLITSFSPATLSPGAQLTITGASFAGGPPNSRNNVTFSATNGLSATVLPLQESSTTLITLVPALTKDSQGTWFQGPVTVCVDTDGHQTCAPQPLVIQGPAAVTGQPGDLLIKFLQSSSQTVLNALQASGPLSQQEATFQQMSAQAQSNLQQKIADALAGNPQKTTLTLGNGQTITAAFDVATISKLEALLAAAPPNFPSLTSLASANRRRSSTVKLSTVLELVMTLLLNSSS